MRGSTQSGPDVVNALLSLDLNTYKGFTPAVEYDAEGLASPRFGKTFKVWSGRDGTFQGFYVGAGPYFALQTVNRFDEDLVNILDSEDDVYIPNANLFVTSRTTPQAALALTGGYRARIAGPSLSALGTDRNGIYLAVDYSYLVGFRYEDYDLAVRFDTDANGLVTIAPTTPPLGINRVTSSRGHGAAVDIGTVLVVDRWDFGFGVNGIGNRITWTGIMREGIVLQSLVDGGDFLRIPLRPTGDDLRVELPVHYTTNIAYHADEWLAIGEYARGYPRPGGVAGRCPILGRPVARLGWGWGKRGTRGEHRRRRLWNCRQPRTPTKAGARFFSPIQRPQSTLKACLYKLAIQRRRPFNVTNGYRIYR
jgi:hypothetical protein